MEVDEAHINLPEAEDETSTSTSEVDEDPTPVESLVAGRAKRATAGNRLSTLLDREADDELELLFAEDEEDVEFEGADGEDASDVQLESSSDDDEDQGPTKGDHDLEGEKELQKQDRAERQARKRKAQDMFMKPPGLRKRVKVDPTTTPAIPTTPAPRQKKKSERVSWIPTPEEGPTRSSSRKQTIQNKEVIHARMKESEKRRLHQIAVMEAAARRKEKLKAKVMTQADRLAEAERTERKNSKSLNRWEETEKKRSEDQKARLTALHNRQLEGPVITWWSGLAKWVNGKLAHVGGRKMVDEVDGKAEQKMKKNSITSASSKKITVLRRDEDVIMIDSPPVDVAQVDVPPSSTAPSSAIPQQQFIFAPPQGPASFLDGIHYYAALPQQAQQPPQGPPKIYGDVPVPLLQPQPATVEHSTRNLVILENFDPTAVRNPEEQRRILFKRRVGKMQKPTHELCAITSLPAKFRDPVTDLPYVNSYAYKEIQRLRADCYTWSDLIGCYVGRAGAAARGVPERFHRKQNAHLATVNLEADVAS
ncbi:MAG: hypothetical protein M1830_008501 [Pleopsidium flavum]|nr:MAG: hypothetical protein M1830_008501 [Pleopsidium flavum]